MNRASEIAFCATALAALCIQTTQADDWPFFRGPSLNGISKEKGWNPQNLKEAWKKDLGFGASSFTVVGSKVLTSANKANKDIVYCFNADDGKEIWRYEFPCKFDKRMFDGGTASTPTIDGQYVYNFSYDGQIQCLKLADGKLVWKKNAISDFKVRLSRWKYAGSPLVLGKLVIFDIGGSPNSTLALDKRTGKKVWGKGSGAAGYATPVPFKFGSTTGVMVFKGKTLLAHDAANGRELWRIPFPSKYDVNASTPIVFGGTFFVSAGYNTGRGVLYQITRSTPKQLWRNNEFQTKMNTAVEHNGYLYGISLKGGLMCLDMKTGNRLWTEGSSGREGTLTLADGKLIVLSDRGEFIIANADPKGFKPIIRRRVLTGRCWAVPVLANGRIYCKSNQGQMVCLDVR